MKKLSLIILTIFYFGGFSQNETLIGKDITLSVGAGKNKFFEKQEEAEFDLAAPIEIPVALNVGISKKLEIGTEWAPIIFNDRSQYNFEGYDSTKNKFGGNLQAFNLNLLYSVNNTYRMNGYIQAGGGYSMLNKRQWIAGDLNELIGQGYNWSIAGGLRYQLGNMYDDVFPWFFDISVAYTRLNVKIDKYAIDNEVQPKTESSWDDLKFGAIDVVMRFGYRLRVKK